MTMMICAMLVLPGIDAIAKWLSGSISSGSTDRALDVARRIRTGTLSINGAQWFHPDTPFGGYKQSGIGRENGVMGFEELLETKVIALPGK